MTRALRVFVALLLAALVCVGAARVAAASDTAGTGVVARVAAASATFREATALVSEDARRAKFLESARLFEAALDGGPRNGALETNAANAFLLGGDVGRAILHYRRALVVRPDDPRATVNLATARGRRRDVIEETPSRALLETFAFWHRALALRTKVALALGAWTFAFLGIAAGVAWRRAARIRGTLVRGGLALLVVALAVGVSGVVELRERAAGDAAVVLAPEVALRTGDGQSYPPRYENPVHAGTEVRVREERAGWIEVELADGKRGWVPRDAVERV